MNVVCGKYPCMMTATGACLDPLCPSKQPPTFQPVQPFGIPVQPYPQVANPQMGCICPPTSEKTCESPICPRKNHFRSSGNTGPIA